MSAPKKPLRSWHYYIDAEGIVWHDGTELDDPELLHFFMEKLHREKDGSLQLICQGELCTFECEDVPYVVQSFDEIKEGLLLHFPGKYEELLKPESLRVGKENVLYCKVKKGEFDARFSRKAYWELAKRISQNEEKKYILHLQGRDYPIQGIS